jgi:cold shock CspA family protein
MEHAQIYDGPDTADNERPARRQRRLGRAKGPKIEERGDRTIGRIVRMLYGQSYGLIRIDDRRDVFFHRKDAKAALFNALDIGDRVVFELIDDPLTGPRAVRVSRA